MKDENPFRYGMVVEGENYCDRPELSRQFVKLVSSGQNLVIQGERRMGKTSFVCETVKSMKGCRLLYVDLFCVKTIPEFCRRVVEAVSRLDASDSFLRKVARIIGNLRPVLSVDRDTGAPMLTIDARAVSGMASVEEVMSLVESHSRSGKLCVVFDEFQDVSDIPESDVLLARLRAMIQFQGKTPFVFLGSVRNKMNAVFDSPKSPFFKSAMSFSVDAINEADFMRFIIARFRSVGRTLDEDMAMRIIRLVDNVSGDVQELCETIWLATAIGCRISETDVQVGLNTVFAREMKAFAALLSGLTSVQMSVLRGLADPSRPKLFSGEFLSLNGIKNVGSVTRAVKRLEEKEIVYDLNGSWRFTNPFFREWLCRRV